MFNDVARFRGEARVAQSKAITSEESESSRGFDDSERHILIKRARDLRPLLQSYAAANEAAGELAPEVIAALEEAKLFEMAMPTRWGGPGASSTTLAAVYFEIARADASTAWVLSVINSNVWLVSRMSAEVQRLVFGSGRYKISSCAGAPGKLVAQGDGSYIIDGNWSYASGSHHADWAIVPVMGEAGFFMALVPIGDLRREKSWNVTGMRATGSDSLVAEGVRVTGANLCPPAEMAAGEGGKTGERFDEASDFWAPTPVLRPQAIVVLSGVAQAILDSIVPGAGKPILNTTFTAKRDSHIYIGRLGEAAAKIRAARSIAERSLSINDAAAVERRLLTHAERVELKAENAVASELLTSTVDQLMTLGGSSAFYDSHPAQRAWRDFSIAIRHIVYSVDLSYEILGREMLGVEPAIMRADLI